MRISSREAYRRWAPTYDATPNPLLALEQRVSGGLLPQKPQLVIDVGCGTGRWLRQFRRMGVAGFGVDDCEEMLRQAALTLSSSDPLLLATAERLPFRQSSADLIVCSFAASYFADLRQALREMARVAARGATILISDLHPRAAAAGWRRSFRSNGSTYEIEHCCYGSADFFKAAARAGLESGAVYQAFLGEPEQALFELAGKADLFRRWRTIPAVWVGVWTKH